MVKWGKFKQLSLLRTPLIPIVSWRCLIITRWRNVNKSPVKCENPHMGIIPASHLRQSHVWQDEYCTYYNLNCGVNWNTLLTGYPYFFYYINCFAIIVYFGLGGWRFIFICPNSPLEHNEEIKAYSWSFIISRYENHHSHLESAQWN